MHHKIILTPSLGGSDYLKTLAGLNVNPKSTFGVRYFSTLELARYLMMCNGVLCPKGFITNLSLSARLYHKVKEIDYFKNYSFEDVFDLIESLNKLRECIVYNEKEEIKKLLNSETFKRKNLAVIEFYELLTKTLDESDLIDEIGLIRYAIDNSKPIPNIEFVRYEEFEYTNLAVALLDKAAGKKVETQHLFTSNKPIIHRYTKAFGQNSEIEDILAYIYQNNIKFDECTIAASDTNTYGKILSNYQAIFKFPLVINSGQSLRDTSCGRLFGSISAWMNNHYHLDYLVELLNSREFNLEKFQEDIGYNEVVANDINFECALSNYDVFSLELIVKTVGDLKLGIDDNKKNEIKISDYEKLVLDRLSEEPDNGIYKRDVKVLEFVKKVAAIFSKGIIEFLGDYLLVDENNSAIENNAFEKFFNVLSLAEHHRIPFKEATKFLKNVIVGFRKPQPGALYLTSINNATSFLRKHLFIVGLDSKVFPGNPSEDPIVLDQDYEQFGVFEASSKQINDNKRLYHNLIGLASSLDIDIHLSYAYYNSETAKEQNASSVLFETYNKENGGDKTVNDFNKEFENKGQDKYRLTGFFDYDLFPLSIIGRKAKDSVIITPEEVETSSENEVSAFSLVSKRGLSATAIEKYVNCQYEFFLSALLHIDQEKETDIYEIIAPNDLGTLAHELMENFSLTDTRDEFLEKAGKKFAEYLIAHPTDNQEMAQFYFSDFLSMMDNGYEMETYEHSPSVLREEDIFTIHQPSGLKIHGFPDKVTRLSDGTYRVVDYKTGSTIKHDVDKKETLLQGALYAYIIQNGKNRLTNYGNKQIKVSEFVFRYLKNKVNVSSYDRSHNIQEYLDYLDEVLLQIKESLKTGKFEKNGDCNSCFFKDVCGGKKS